MFKHVYKQRGQLKTHAMLLEEQLTAVKTTGRAQGMSRVGRVYRGSRVNCEQLQGISVYDIVKQLLAQDNVQ